MNNKIQNVLAVTLLIGIVGTTFFFAYQKQFSTAKESPVTKEATRTQQKEITIESTINGVTHTMKKIVSPDNTYFEHSVDPNITSQYYTNNERVVLRETIFSFADGYQGTNRKEVAYEWESFLNREDKDASYLLACLDKNHKVQKNSTASFGYWDLLYMIDEKTYFCDYEIARMVIRLNEKLCEKKEFLLLTNYRKCVIIYT